MTTTMTRIRQLVLLAAASLTAVSSTLAFVSPSAFRPRTTTTLSSAGLAASHHDEQQQEPKLNLSLCLVDHYDSYTYNLYDMLAQVCIKPPMVITKDCNNTLPLEKNIDGIVLSPGPGRPPHDTGISLDIIQDNPTLPILGVCLGHQAIGHAYGANITQVAPIHGQVHAIQHTHNDTLFQNVTSPLHVVRYHSLAVQEWNNDSIPLVATAWYENASGDNIIMGLSHRHNPHYGVQFHPESIGTQEGMIMIRNFCHTCAKLKAQRQASDNDDNSKARVNGILRNGVTGSVVNGWLETASHKASMANGVTSSNENGWPLSRQASLVNGVTNNARGHDSARGMKSNTKRNVTTLVVRKVHSRALPVDVYSVLYGDQRHSVWLDSSNASGEARYSIMAGMDGPNSRRIEYILSGENARLVRVYNCHGKLEETHEGMDIMTFLQHDMDSTVLVGDDDLDLPFDYRGGYLGYLGYEVRHDTSPPCDRRDDFTKHAPTSDVPTAAFLFADCSLVYDHWKKEWYLLGLTRDEEYDVAIMEWMDRVEATIHHINKVGDTVDKRTDLLVQEQIRQHTQPLAFMPNRSPSTYRNNIATCHEQIRLGESYELCLTNQLEATVRGRHSKTPLQLYKLLRQRNPAPFAAFLNFQCVSICCSSPERFVSVKKRRRGASNLLDVEAKPIKGTCARQVMPNGRARTAAEAGEDDRRARELESCVKNRAENLMIVDLLRNDLNRVCMTGSVHVPKLMHIESYATVHQMVSTIRGTLDTTEVNAIDVLKACFPGGSMTGAPKIRTMEILNELEEGVPRGPYSGCLGYISLNGSMDMNIVIRSAVLTPGRDGWHVSVGAGGAITALSDCDDEYEEMLLKARAVLEAVQAWADSSSEAPMAPPIANMTYATLTA